MEQRKLFGRSSFLTDFKFELYRSQRTKSKHCPISRRGKYKLVKNILKLYSAQVHHSARNSSDEEYCSVLSKLLSKVPSH